MSEQFVIHDGLGVARPAENKSSDDGWELRAFPVTQLWLTQSFK